MEQAFESVAEELEIDEDDRSDQDELGQGRDHHMLAAKEDARKRPAHHVAHGQVEQGNAEDERDNEAHAHALFLGSGARGRGLVRKLRGALPAGRRGRESLAPRLGPVARLVDQGGDALVDARDVLGRKIRDVFDFHAVLQ